MANSIVFQSWVSGSDFMQKMLCELKIPSVMKGLLFAINNWSYLLIAYNTCRYSRCVVPLDCIKMKYSYKKFRRYAIAIWTILTIVSVLLLVPEVAYHVIRWQRISTGNNHQFHVANFSFWNVSSKEKLEKIYLSTTPNPEKSGICSNTSDNSGWQFSNPANLNVTMIYPTQMTLLENQTRRKASASPPEADCQQFSIPDNNIAVIFYIFHLLFCDFIPTIGSIIMMGMVFYWLPNAIIALELKVWARGALILLGVHCMLCLPINILLFVNLPLLTGVSVSEFWMVLFSDIKLASFLLCPIAFGLRMPEFKREFYQMLALAMERW